MALRHCCVTFTDGQVAPNPKHWWHERTCIPSALLYMHTKTGYHKHRDANPWWFSLIIALKAVGTNWRLWVEITGEMVGSWTNHDVYWTRKFEICTTSLCTRGVWLRAGQSLDLRVSLSFWPYSTSLWKLNTKQFRRDLWRRSKKKRRLSELCLP